MKAEDSQAIILMGVSGAGKTTVGRRLADELGWHFYEGDDYHSAANRSKMAAGRPLTDADRGPWLAAVRALIDEQLAAGKSLVLACSALKADYRRQLGADLANIHVVYLQGQFDLIRQRLEARQGHYMGPELLRSQFAALQEPQEALVVPLDQPLSQILSQIMDALQINPQLNE